MMMKRLAPEDFTYWFVRKAFGWSVVLQVLWTFDRPPSAHAIAAVNDQLGRSPLNRRVIGSRFPFARPHWVHSEQTPALVIDDGVISAGAVEEWAAGELYDTPLDPEHGQQWRLRGSATTEGGFVLSLTALHLVADGKATVSAAADAFGGSAADSLGTRSMGRVRALLADAGDSIAQMGSAGIGAVRATVATLVSDNAPSPPTRAPRPAMNVTAPAARGPWAVVSVNVDDWTKVADDHGGTANSLFVAVISGLLRTSGYAPTGHPIKVGIPVSSRTPDDEGGNATAGVSVHLVDEPIAGGDLGPIRRKCKAAFAALAEGRRPAMIHLLPLMWLLPTSLIVKAVSSGGGMPDAVASNLGAFSETLSELGGVPASGVAFRGIAQGVDPAQRYRFGEGVQAWMLEVGDQLTFSVAAFDEVRFADRAHLHRLLAAELDAWGVPHSIW
ncbi:hypothetical protein BH683_021050 [Williamsia sp. 1138]|uniref:hypothetical protein n=1 Tax=Williamsia sp. 1138 TaxID=1903117 RepID=UPI000A11E7C9|nr:hypothetical protein [Williamsia sp. 1138]OZG26934.1 hypothetical protein BH683_021050 [Williamsia sp. 1138]